jgi:general secretion pathway protein I
MIRRPQHRPSGFTLIEVVVAMFVIALGVGALLTTLTSSAESIGRLRDKSFAEWVALNQISTARLARPIPSTGVTTGEVEYAGAKWRWRQEIIDQQVAGILRIDVAVAPATAASAQSADSDAKTPALARAYGFLGTNVGAPSGFDPSWTLPPRNPGAP